MSTQQRSYPPIAEMVTASLILTIIGGIVMATYVPHKPPLAVPTIFLGASAAVTLVSVLQLARLKDFAWDSFVAVAKWAILAYVLAAGLIEFSFIKDHTRGGPLLVVTLMLVMFAVDVPLIIGFTVAKLERR